MNIHKHRYRLGLPTRMNTTAARVNIIYFTCRGCDRVTWVEKSRLHRLITNHRGDQS